MRQEIQKWGSITILSGIVGTIVASGILWLFDGVHNHDVKIGAHNIQLEGLTAAIDNLTAAQKEEVIAQREFMKSNTDSHNLIVDQLSTQTVIMGIIDVRVEDVEDDCQRNEEKIDDCWKQINNTKGVTNGY